MSSLLEAYMKRHSLTDAQFAAVIGRDRSLVNRLRNGAVRPTLDLAAVIESETKGEVPMKSWVDIDPRPSATNASTEIEAAR